MNDTNENTVLENNEKVKIEYVNPLNPNEVLKTNTKENIIETQEPTLEINETETIEEQKEISEEGEQLIESNNNLKTKNKKKLLFIILALVVLVIVLVIALMLPKILDKEEEPKTPVIEVPAQQENKIALSNIISNSTNNVFYNTLTSNYTVNIYEENNSIVFNLDNINEGTSKQIIFTLSDRNLKITLNTLEDNTDNLNAIYAILDSIGQYYGHEIDEVGNYVYSSTNNYNFNIPSITTKEIIDPTTELPNGVIEVSINIDTDISTKGLENMVFTIDDLNIHSETIKNNSIILKKGDLVLYTNNSDIYTIIIGQRNNLNDNTYNTISSVIELLYPEEIESFKSKFTSLSTISFDKYKITVDPILNEHIFPQYQTNYKFVSIEITKQAE